MKKTQTYFLPAIIWFIISTILLTLPGTAFPKENWLDKLWVDKWVHIGMFTIMVVLWCYGWRSYNKNWLHSKLTRIFIFTGIAGLGYGIGMEFIQYYFIPHRSFDIGDIIADAIGCAAGTMYSMKRYIKK